MSRTMNAEEIKMLEAEEHLIFDMQLMVHEAAARHGLTYSQVAERAGISKARMSQIMGSNANPTVRTIAKIMTAIGEKATIVERLRESSRDQILFDVERLLEGTADFIEPEKRSRSRAKTASFDVACWMAQMESNDNLKVYDLSELSMERAA